MQLAAITIFVFVFVQSVHAATQRSSIIGAPELVSYQGKVTVSGLSYNGICYFKFVIIDRDGTNAYWSNDSTSGGGNEPSSGVALIVRNGLFAILLGDTSLSRMIQSLNSNILAVKQDICGIGLVLTKVVTPDSALISESQLCHLL